MAKNPEKTVGNHGKCFKCNKEMFCNEVEYKGEKKAQWQNADGKSHYTSDGDCRESEKHIKEVTQSIVSQKIQLKDIDLDMDVLDKTLYVTKAACQFLKAIEFGVYEQLGQDANPNHIGMYVKIIADKLLGIPNLQTILEEIKGKE